MSTRPRLRRSVAEHLLDGATDAGPPPLAELLAAAAAPAHPGELAGRQAVTQAYRAHRDAVPLPRRRSMLKTALAKALTVKAAAIAAVAVGGGVALAATTGVLPNPLGTTGKPSASHSPKPSHSPGAKGSPSPNLEGLCKAYAAKPDGERGKALESPAFQALVTAAGGLDKVTDYCVTLLPSSKPSAPGAKPSTPGKPSTKPSGAPTVKPTDHPGAPSGTPSHR
ncbi:MAG: hypothetical protein HOU81_01045 [Hamadaea sp.]|uniref:hypothetical protein n=1 Tax=Hamadaea sp. TaxID=2024425 RepID=UPI00185486EE|nr:hypothetical protein [Hamadaea sp.]NUR69384.1 hypothetical protein [Hamadaea sp.]NUT23201.1 hypothetical protein [Hamadaea sp.]